MAANNLKKTTCYLKRHKPLWGVYYIYFALLNPVLLDDKKLKKKYFQNSHKSNMATQIGLLLSDLF